jgi:hypothetical protein
MTQIPRALPERGAAWATPSIEAAATLPLIEAIARLRLSIFLSGPGSIQKGPVATTEQDGSYFPQHRLCPA